MTAINYTPGETPISIIDGHRTLTPAACFSWDSSLGAVVFVPPLSMLNPTAPPPTHFPSPTAAPILSLAWADLTGEILVVCSSEVAPTSLRAIDPLTGGSRIIPTALPPTLVASGRSTNAFASNGDQILVVFIHGDAPATTPRTLPHTAHAIAYDDARDDVALVSRTARKLMRIDRSLAGVIEVRDIPTVVPMGTRIQIAINPKEDGVIYLWSEASASIWRLVPPATGTLMTATALNLTAAPQPRSLDFTDQGHMLVSNNGSLVEFQPGSAPGTWVVDTTSVFVGKPAAQNFRVMRSRSNFEVGVHDTPGWTTNIDPINLPTFPVAPDCAADIAPNLNVDDMVNVGDLLAVITAWGPCPSQVRCVGDIDDDDDVDVADLLGVITAWGPCP